LIALPRIVLSFHSWFTLGRPTQALQGAQPGAALKVCIDQSTSLSLFLTNSATCLAGLVVLSTMRVAR
jgi:hypothetical protein